SDTRRLFSFRLLRVPEERANSPTFGPVLLIERLPVLLPRPSRVPLKTPAGPPMDCGAVQ
ncbi:hypothetical protein, partial [Klebsiella pneumoniae]|uniref:hypothetical protein n=1 Tax=Klebsiella pneumoniae TaxID=573 RepID=UPI00396A0919